MADDTAVPGVHVDGRGASGRASGHFSEGSLALMKGEALNVIISKKRK